MIPNQCLDPALDSRAGGVPLVETVEHGAIVLRRAGPGTPAVDIGGWTSHSHGSKGLEAVASGPVCGVPLYAMTTLEGRPPGTAVCYSPALAALGFEANHDGVLVGPLMCNEWALPLIPDEHGACRIEAAGGLIDLVNAAGGHPPAVGSDRMAVNTGASDLTVRAGNSSDDKILNVLKPGEADRWRYAGRDANGLYRWTSCSLPRLVATVFIRRDFVSGASRGSPADMELRPARGAELARTSSLRRSRARYKWARVAEDRDLAAEGVELTLAPAGAEPPFRFLEFVLRGPDGMAELDAITTAPGATAPVRLHPDAEHHIDVHCRRTTGNGWQVACAPDTADLPEGCYLSIHELVFRAA